MKRLRRELLLIFSSPFVDWVNDLEEAFEQTKATLQSGVLSIRISKTFRQGTL
jgi:hypothetical protein